MEHEKISINGEHKNEIAKRVLRNEYSDYDRNSWHYDSEYKNIVEALEMQKQQFQNDGTNIRYPLFEYMSEAHGIQLIDDEMQQVINICRTIYLEENYGSKERSERKKFLADKMEQLIDYWTSDHSCSLSMHDHLNHIAEILNSAR